VTSNESRKRAARDFQAANPGTSYTRARRLVARDKRRPLTAVLGTGIDGTPVRLNLEWQSRGGDGPHCAVSGPGGSGRAALLAALATGLFSGQNRGDCELVVSGCDDVLIGVQHTRVDAGLSGRVNGLLEERYELLRSLGNRDIEEARAAGHQIPTIVVLIKAPVAGLQRGDDTLARLVRVGRAVGINVVLTTETELPGRLLVHEDMTPAQALTHLLSAQLSGAVLANVTSMIYALGNGRGTLRTPGRWDGSHVRADTLTDFVFEAMPGNSSGLCR
jgi:hypothetical protein